MLPPFRSLWNQGNFDHSGHLLATANDIGPQKVVPNLPFLYLGKVKKTLPEAQRTQGIDSKTWVNLSARIVQNWFQCLYLNWWQVWPLVFDYKFDHLVALLASATNLVTRECHLHQLTVGSTSGTTYISLIWSSGGATCISSKVVH